MKKNLHKLVFVLAIGLLSLPVLADCVTYYNEYYGCNNCSTGDFRAKLPYDEIHTTTYCDGQFVSSTSQQWRGHCGDC